MKNAIQKAAIEAHEVNRVFCEACGDFSQVPWSDAADWQRESAIAGVTQIVDDPSISPEKIHKCWLKDKQADGWKFGMVKDAEKKEHPCMVPYSLLPEQQKAKDLLFGTVVRAVLANYGVLPIEAV